MTALALLLALVVLAIAPWAQIPAPTRSLLPLSIAAPELSAWLLVLALLATLLSVIALRRPGGSRRPRRLALALSLIAAAFPTYVLAQIPGSVRRMDAEWHRAFGAAASGVASIDQAAQLRPHPFTWRELFFGLRVRPVPSRARPSRTRRS